MTENKQQEECPYPKCECYPPVDHLLRVTKCKKGFPIPVWDDEVEQEAKEEGEVGKSRLRLTVEDIIIGTVGDPTGFERAARDITDVFMREIKDANKKIADLEKELEAANYWSLNNPGQKEHMVKLQTENEKLTKQLAALQSQNKDITEKCWHAAVRACTRNIHINEEGKKIYISTSDAKTEYLSTL